jgi:hypothetical protein
VFTESELIEMEERLEASRDLVRHSDHRGNPVESRYRRGMWRLTATQLESAVVDDCRSLLPPAEKPQ